MRRGTPSCAIDWPGDTQTSPIVDGVVSARYARKFVDNKLFAYSPLPERAAIRWPGGARVAFYLGLNIEHYRIDRPSSHIFA